MTTSKRASTFALLLIAFITISAAAQSTDGPDRIVLEVSGLRDSACGAYLEDVLLADVEGIKAVEADHNTGLVTIQYDPEATTPNDLVGAIETCPQFRVTGSPTHEIDTSEATRQRPACCDADRCDESGKSV